MLLDTSACPAWVMPNADGAGYYTLELAAGDFARTVRCLVGRLLARATVWARSPVGSAVCAAFVWKVALAIGARTCGQPPHGHDGSG
jgi:hypothetical protein